MEEGTQSKSAWLAETRRLLSLEWSSENDLALSELDSLPRRLLESLGKAVCFLDLDSLKSGLYGRTIGVFTFTKSKPLDTSCLSPGDIVRVVPNEGTSKLLHEKKKGGSLTFPSGIVSKVSDNCIEVAFSEDEADKEASPGSINLGTLRDHSPLRLEKLPNEQTHRKQLRALQDLDDISTSHPAYHVSQVLFGEAEPQTHPSLPDGSSHIQPYNNGLNVPQAQAIEFALGSRDVALIHGPPGTGKTTAVVELIRQAVQCFGMRVLVCAPSNVAVDNIILRLSPFQSKQRQDESGEGTKLPSNESGQGKGTGRKGKRENERAMRMVRVGHPARLLPQVLEHSLDAVVSRAEGSEIVRDVRDELQGVLNKMSGKGKEKSKAKKGRERVNYKELRSEAKTLRKEIRTREKGVVQGILKNSNVVLATNAGAAGIGKLLGYQHNGNVPAEEFFDLVIIDEAAQAIEASCWIPILLGKRLVLAGDHKQLPPTIKSDEASRGLLGVTLFDRVVHMYGDKVVKLLSIQYRMHQLINDFSSHELYDGRLVADSSVAGRKLADLSHIRKAKPIEESDGEPIYSTLLLVDTASCGMEEATEGEEEANTGKGSKLANDALVGSKFNTGEARIVSRIVEQLISIGLEAHEIAVITPYNAQVHLLRSLLSESYPQLEIKSVDGFQGREKEAVVLSLVRSNAFGNVGFLSDDRRLNVAITRARRHVSVVCDSETLSSKPDSFLGRMVDYFYEHATVLSAESFEEELLAGAMGTARRPVKHHASASTTTKPNAGKPVTEKRERNKPVSEERVSELLSEIENFMRDSSKSHVDFPPSLSPGERRVLHELAEDMGVLHESHGEGETRFIRITKLMTPSPQVADPVPSPQDVESVDSTETSTDEQDTSRQKGEGEDFSDEKGDGKNDGKEQVRERDERAQVKPAKSTSDEEEKKAFAAVFLPKRYMELVSQGIDANEACVLAMKETEIAFRERHQQSKPAATSASPDNDKTKTSAQDSKPPPSTSKQLDTSTTCNPTPENDRAELGSKPPSNTSAQPTSELQKLRALQAERYRAKKIAEQEVSSKAKRSSAKSSSSKPIKPTAQEKAVAKASKVEKILTRSGLEQDDDQLLDSLLAASKVCSFDKCRESVQTLGATCTFCKLRFCYTHMQAETHGCGSSARVSARQQVKSTPSHNAPKQIKAHQKTHLKKELAKKIASANEQRATSAAKKKKKIKKG